MKQRLNLTDCTDKILLRSFYARPTLTVAKELIGCVLVNATKELFLSGRIVEVEAYLGTDDPASHAAQGRTPRTEHQWEEAGHLYVYLIYGMYHCVNIVTERKGLAGCVLLRALEPLSGMEKMRIRRNFPKTDIALCNGPGKLTQSLGISRTHNRMDVTRGPICVIKPNISSDFQISTSGRIGLTVGEKLPYRYFIKDNPFVSCQKMVSK